MREHITKISSEELNAPLTPDQVQELKNASTHAEQMEQQHPILQFSPFILKTQKRNVAEYLGEFSDQEQEVYKSYYSEEV